MKNQRCKWLGLALLSLATLFVMGGCGGGSSSTPPPTVAKASISGSVTFPSLNSLVGKQVAKSVAAVIATPTVELRDLNGKVVATMSATGAGTIADPFSYSFTGIDTADYVVKAFSGSKVVKAIVDKNSLVTATTRNIDTISTTTVIVAEKKLGATLGTLGEFASAAITSNAIATVNPAALEGSINTAVNTVQYSAATATSANIDLVNLVNVVSASVNNDVDPAKFIAGTVIATISTTQYMYSSVTGAVAGASPVTVQATTVSATLTTTATNYTAPPSNSVSYIEKVYDFNTTPAGIPLSGVAVTTVGLTPEITTTTDANGLFILPGIPQSTSFYVKMSKATYADALSNTFSLTGNLDSTDRPYALFLPSMLTGWGNSTGNGVIRSRVVVSTDLVNGFIGGAVVTATDKTGGTAYPVKYVDSTGIISSTLTSTNPANGQYVIVNVPAGHTVDVTATNSGYTFNTRTFTVKAGAVSQSRIVGIAVATTPTPTPTTTSPTKAALQSGLYEFRGDSSYNQANNTTVNYYNIERIGLAADGVTLTRTVPYYYDRGTKTWTSSVPAGFPSNNYSDYSLNTTSGTWVIDPNGPQGYTAVFNADGTARITNPTGGDIIDIMTTSVDISGQPISSSGLDGAPLLANAAAFPTGSVLYNLTITSVNDSYTVWDSSFQLATSPTGGGLVTLDPVTKILSGSFNTVNVTNATAAHIHDGNVGVAGPVAVPLTQSAPGIWTVPANTVLTDAQIARLQAGGFYVNIHTTLNPAGEIRGQLFNFIANPDMFTANLTVAQEVPAPILPSGASLASVPAAFAESTFQSIYMDSQSSTEYFFAKFADGSTTNVNIYRNMNTTSSAPQLIGTTTAAIVTVSGQQLLEISIPANVRTTYQITSNPIFAVVNGVVMQGEHSPAGDVDSNKSGGGMFNNIAINHLKANINTALAKPAVAKNIPKAILGW